MSQLGIEPLFAVDIPIDASVRNLVLAPYKLHCRYLNTVTATNRGNGQPFPSAQGEFSIPESCYISDTGHFNAVEFNICYNQIAYCLLAHIVQNRWLEELAGWSLDDFRRRQLSNCLIVQFSSSFHKPLNARHFYGNVKLDRVSVKRGTIFMKTSCAFHDDSGASSKGGALIAIICDSASSPMPFRVQEVRIIDRLKMLPARDREEALSHFLREKISAAVHSDPAQIGPRDNLLSLGADSMKAVELKVSIGAELHLSLSSSLLFDYPTIEGLAQYLMARIAGVETDDVRVLTRESARMDSDHVVF